MQKGDRIVAALNPAAGRGRSVHALERLREIAGRHGIDIEALESVAPGDMAAAVVRAAAGRPRMLAVVGGDGSLGEAATGCARLGEDAPPVLVVPAGRGNSFYKALTGDRPWVEWADRILTNHRVRPADVGEIEGEDRRWVLGCTVGYLAEALQATDRLPRVGGRGAYLVGGLLAALSTRAFETVVEVDGATVFGGRAKLVAVCGTAYRGGRMRLAPGADIDTGVLNVVVVGDCSRRRLIRLLTRAADGSHLNEPEVTATDGHRIVVHRPAGTPTEADGSLWSAGRDVLAIRVCPGALPLAVPD